MTRNVDALQIISRKYAQAYINIYLDTLSQESYDAIKRLEHFLRMHKKIAFFLEVPSIPYDEKKEIIDRMIQQFNVPVQIKHLYFLVLKENRSFIMPEILRIIRELYQKRKNVMEFSITTSHKITEKNLHTIVQYLAHKLNCDIIYEYTVDPTLIAGMRLQSNTRLWEYSVSKQLQKIRLSF